MDDDLTEWLREVDDAAADYADVEISNERLTFGWGETWRLSFARAIARECARICEEQAKLPECPERATYCADAICERFGIEK